MKNMKMLYELSAVVLLAMIPIVHLFRYNITQIFFQTNSRINNDFRNKIGEEERLLKEKYQVEKTVRYEKYKDLRWFYRSKYSHDNV